MGQGGVSGEGPLNGVLLIFGTMSVGERGGKGSTSNQQLATSCDVVVSSRKWATVELIVHQRNCYLDHVEITVPK